MTKGSGFKWAVLFLMVFGAAMLNFSNMVFSARSVDVMAQFGMDQAQLTAVSGIGVLPGALFSVFMGGFFDKRGPSSIRFAGAALLLLAAACQVWRVFASSYAELFAITFLSGTFFLPTQVLPAKMIEAWFERSELGTAMGIYGAAAGVGITAAFALGALFPTTTMALAFCACGYVVAAVYWLFAAKLPQSDGGHEARNAQEAAAGGDDVSIKAVLKSRNMWLVMVCGGLAAGAPLLFEQFHAFCGITDALVYCMTDEDEVKELLKYLKDWELQLAEQLCSRLHPDAILHHDDWGSETNSFMRPEMFDEYFTEYYKEIYGYYHDHGVEVIIHHNDSYGANLVPYMIEMGIDVWQGCMRSNDVPALVDKYKGQIAFMGNIDNKQVDFDGWTVADCEKAARLALEGMEPAGYIPCITQGIPGGVYPGTYMGLVNSIDKLNAERFRHSLEELAAARDQLDVFEYALEDVMPERAKYNQR